MNWNPLSWLPYTREGRQTLIYLTFAGSGVALTAVVIWAMIESLARIALWPTFTQLALIVAGALMVSVIGLAMFVSIRAFKASKDGIEVSGEGGGE